MTSKPNQTVLAILTAGVLVMSALVFLSPVDMAPHVFDFLAVIVGGIVLAMLN